MAKIDLEDVSVIVKELTVDEIRADDDALATKVYEWLDEAQAPVFGDDRDKQYLVIEITKGPPA